MALEIRGHKLHTKWWVRVTCSFSVCQLSTNSPVLTSMPVILGYKLIFSLWLNTEYSLFAKLLTVCLLSPAIEYLSWSVIRYLKISSRKGGGGDDTRSRWVCKYFYLELPTKCIHMILKIFYFPLTQKENIPWAVQKMTAQDKMHGAAKMNFFFNLNNCCQTTFL